MEKQISTYDKKHLSYFALIMENFFEFKEAPLKLKLKCFNFIEKCLDYLSYPVRLIIREKLDSYAVNYFANVTGLEVYFERLKESIK